MKLVGETERQRAIESDLPDSPVYSQLECDVLVKSIGYKSLELEGVPFDRKTNTIPNSFGCVVDPASGELQVGLYCAGWVKRGPVGIIDATLRDSLETFRMIKHHLENDLLKGSSTTTDEVRAMLKQGAPLVETEGW
jgi:NADPH-dependent glutamate synthase beta subunit-like oxidoreductase